MAEVAFTLAAAADVVVVDVWDATVPAFAGLRALRVEPRRWWLIDAGAAVTQVTADLADTGAVVAVDGGLMRATLTGPGWRALLMIAGVFDAEDAGFGPGDCAATVIHHVPVWIAPVAADCADVFFAASYARGLAALWAAAIARGIA